MSEITNIHQEIFYLLDKLNKGFKILEKNILNSCRREVDTLDDQTEAIHSVPVVVVETAKTIVEMVDESAPKEAEEGILLDVRTRSVLDVRARTIIEEKSVMVENHLTQVQSEGSKVHIRESKPHSYVDPYSVHYTPFNFVIADMYALDDPLSCGVLLLSYHVIIWRHGSKIFVFDPGGFEDESFSNREGMM